jgi:hypothetical protein
MARIISVRSWKEDASERQPGYAISWGQNLKRASPKGHEALMQEVRDQPQTPEHQAVLKHAEDGDPEALQALLKAKHGDTAALNKLLAQARQNKPKS